MCLNWILLFRPFAHWLGSDPFTLGVYFPTTMFFDLYEYLSSMFFDVLAEFLFSLFVFSLSTFVEFAAFDEWFFVFCEEILNSSSYSVFAWESGA
jgi:hypothetical protein